MTARSTRRTGATRLALALALPLALGLLLLGAPSATAGTALDRAAAALASGDTLYVDPGATGVLGSQADEVRSRIGSAGTPVFVAALPQSEVTEAGSGADLVQRLASRTDRHGTYLAVTSRGLYGISDDLDNSAVINTVRTAANDNGSAAPALLQALDGITSLAASGGSSDGSRSNEAGSNGSGSGTAPFDERSAPSSGIGAGLLTPFLVIAALAGGGALLVSRSRRKRREQEEARAFAEVRQAAAEDVTRFGEDITGLDLDVDAAGVDDATRRDYAAALDAYDTAKRALDGARRAEDLSAVSTALEDGRYSMECVRARMAGRPLPERRAPCFFNPQHGPSAQDVEWAPPGGAPRPVPACAADAERVLRGEDPDARQVVVGGTRRPYWEAGPAYGPWAGGYYGGAGMAMGGMLPGILVGTVLGGALSPGWGMPGGIIGGGGFGGGWGDGDGGGGWGGGDGGGGWGGGDGGGGGWGGGDGGWGGGGDFGGGGGDFGGGGGDFGG
jgi:hypothetical protein